MSASKYKDSVNEIIDAWESLAGGREYEPSEIENWLRRKMAPAINRARKIVGRKKPKGGD
jgi:hypothetical protein